MNCTQVNHTFVQGAIQLVTNITELLDPRPEIDLILNREQFNSPV
ncbi:hypothetical protein PCC7424_5114 [Gloeothece citriformis PCC 7424]|uniref:Uncharacterized protein n=1 Tax=Gloeothece citriformis (strain PCC 7424) TaxID=65393 RepID=B7KGX8_GLOC7|nr:hypothetical protein PCC7424_5114 [Gloeothece citriformis PCC 7424]